MLRGDFNPYLLKSSDRGRTWTSIRGTLPDREQIWTLAEDHVNRNILFAGTEHGAFVTLDGGQSWQPLRAGLPSVAVRDIQIQRRENDLVLGTFGRGIYIMDDYSPLRTLAARQAASAEGMLVPPRPTRVYFETPFQRAGIGNGLFSGENPPFGALLSYVARERDAGRIGDRAAHQRRRRKNDQRGAWSGRRRTQSRRVESQACSRHGIDARGWRARRRPGRGGPRCRAADTTGGGEGAAAQRGGGRGGPPPPGPLVAPGTYTVQLARRAGATITPIGAPQRLRLNPVGFALSS